ncbi:hypothetical protein C8R46DRAFT_1286768 [Mycena filopes]|nr:hypothetical protein C8R46DRAFT_1286768 [Mycena filopes]
MDARAPPFSLLEFGDIVSAALASPDIPPLASASSSLSHALVSLRSSSSTTLPRRAASEPAPEPATHRRARSSVYCIPEMQRLSAFNAFDTATPKDASAFEPAVPLVIQYERVYGQSVPSLPSYASYSSSPSASSAYTDSSPSTSTSSCSSGSSYPPTPSTLSPVSESCESRWSLSSSACSDADPVFLTKPNSGNSRPPPTQMETPTLRRRRTRLSLGLGLRLHLGRGVLPPAKPVPACPLPPLPAYASSRHTSTPPTLTAYADQRAKSLRSVQSLHSFHISPLHDEEAGSLTTRARPSLAAVFSAFIAVKVGQIYFGVTIEAPSLPLPVHAPHPHLHTGRVPALTASLFRFRGLR